MRRVFALLLLVLLVLSLPVTVWGQGQLIPGNRTLAGTMNAGLSTGTATAYVLTLDPPITAYVLEQFFAFRAHVTNTGPATLNVNGVGARPLRKWKGGVLQDLAAGDLHSGQEILVYYDGAVLQVMSLTSAGGASGVIGTLQQSDGLGGFASYGGSACPESGSVMHGLSATGAATCISIPSGGGSGTIAPVLLTQVSASAPNGVNLGALAAGVLATTVTGGIATVSSLPRPAGDLVGTTSAQVLENKQVIPRRISVADASTILVDLTTFDLAVISELSQATLIANPAGSAEPGKIVRFQVHSTTPRSLSWGSQWSAEAGFPLPTTTTGGAIYDHFWWQYNSGSGNFDLIYNSQLSQLVLPTGVVAGTYTCPSSLTVDTRGRLTAVVTGTCGGGGGGGDGATPAGSTGDVQWNRAGALAADHGNLTWDPISKTLLTPNVQTSQHRSYYEFQDLKGRKLYLTIPAQLTNHRHIVFPNEDGEVCVKGGSCFGSGAVGIAGTPTTGQIAEWASGATIQGVTATGTGAVVRATAPTLVTPTLGVATATSLNKVTLTPPATSATLTIPDGTTATLQGTDTYVGRNTTDTLTNKRVSKRVTILSSSATYTCPGDTSDQCRMANTAATGTLTIAQPTGTPNDGDLLLLRMKCTNAQTLSFAAIFVASPNVAIPTTCAASTTTETIVGAMYSSDLTKWVVIASN
jgi:hypothetical protein